jgi:NitT/TauT family transport system permease protein
MGRNWLYPVASAVIAIVAWQVLVVLFRIPNFLIPLPGTVLERLISDSNLLLYHSGITLLESVGGFVFSVVFGIPLGILLVWSPLLERSIMPWLVVSQSFPKVALAPIVVIWFGLGLFPKVLISFSVAFFPVVIGTIAGLMSVEPEVIELARSMQATPYKTFMKIRMPFAMPSVFAGLKVAVAFATVGAVVGEWVGATSGLGYLMLWANANLDTPLLFAIVVCLMVIGLVTYYAVVLAERLALPWHVSVRGTGLEVTI